MFAPYHGVFCNSGKGEGDAPTFALVVGPDGDMKSELLDLLQKLGELTGISAHGYTTAIFDMPSYQTPRVDHILILVDMREELSFEILKLWIFKSIVDTLYFLDKTTVLVVNGQDEHSHEFQRSELIKILEAVPIPIIDISLDDRNPIRRIDTCWKIAGRLSCLTLSDVCASL